MRFCSSLQHDDAGLDVLILEASRRTGGRVFTRDDIAGHPEGGGSEIGSDYARAWNMIGRLGAPETVKWLEIADLRMAMHIDGRSIRMADRPDASSGARPPGAIRHHRDASLDNMI